jgi:hypothetical protein
MKNTEFCQNFDLDRSARSPRAMAKHAPVGYPITLTADGAPFSHTAEYFFYDGQAVRSTNGLRRIDAEHLGSTDLKVVRIDQLRFDRDKAIEDAEIACVRQIEQLRDRIREFEAQKRPENRTSKFVLMARG